MKASGRVTHTAAVPRVSSTVGVITELEASLLNELYQELVPRYGILCEQYRSAKAKACNARRKSLFPSQDKWQPPCGLEPDDQLLLLGPQRQVFDKPRIVTDYPSSQKEIVFVAASHESIPSRHFRSWVQLRTDCTSRSAIPMVGQIQRIFAHKFGTETYDIVLVHKCVSVNHDIESGLWWTELPLQYIPVMLPVTQLFPPLVVAREESVIWFLNCK